MKTTRHLLTIAAFLLMSNPNLFAQGPNDSGTYYKNADGKKGAALKTALYEIISANHTKLSYDDLWEYFKTTDKRSDGKIWDMYSNVTDYTPVSQGSNYPNEGSGYNREHSFPNSWFGGSRGHIAYADLNHLYPTDGYINNMRSNFCFGETKSPTKTSKNGFSKLGPCFYVAKVTCFEPNDMYKGDFARTYFYMVTRYENEIVNWFQSYSNKEGVAETLAGNKYPGLTDWQLNMLMEWSAKDPVSEDKEVPRNKAVYGIQHNRNPFIDYPGLEEYIWGSLKDVAFSYDNYQNPTGIITTKVDQHQQKNVMYNMAGQAVGKSYKGLVIVNGKKMVNK
ncbi:MAG: endonuclease [Prevotella sp.]|nr:endonuclease [Prevotella sp.]